MISIDFLRDYASRAATPQQEEFFLDLARRRRLNWRSISTCLRRSYPVPGFGKRHPVPIVDDLAARATPENADGFYRDAAAMSEKIGDLAARDVFKLLSDFCFSLSESARNKERAVARQIANANGGEGATTTQSSRPDLVYQLALTHGVEKLCKFCFRPAEGHYGKVETCSHHSPVKSQYEYRLAAKRGATTPPELKMAMRKGVLHVTATGNHGKLVQALRLMERDWDEAVLAGAVQWLIDSLTDKTYKPLKSADTYSGWVDGPKPFLTALLKAFQVWTAPESADFTAAWLPHAIREVEDFKKTRHPSRRPGDKPAVAVESVKNLAAKLDGRPGWQSEISRSLGISRQRVSQILKALEMNTAATTEKTDFTAAVKDLAVELKGQRGWQSEAARRIGISRQRVSQIAKEAGL